MAGEQPPLSTISALGSRSQQGRSTFGAGLCHQLLRARNLVLRPSFFFRLFCGFVSLVSFSAAFKLRVYLCNYKVHEMFSRAVLHLLMQEDSVSCPQV